MQYINVIYLQTIENSSYLHRNDVIIKVWYVMHFHCSKKQIRVDVGYYQFLSSFKAAFKHNNLSLNFIIYSIKVTLV